jgi:hypothetical protein
MTIVELEFEGGPMNGRRITAVGSRADLPVVMDETGHTRIAWGTPAGGIIGIYRFARQYDCARTFECVYVFRWVDQPP